MVGRKIAKHLIISRFSVKYFQIFLILLSIQFVYTQSTSPPRSPWSGREVFHKKGCIQCHSIYGNGGEGGPDLGENLYYGTYLELAALMWNHFPKMYEKIQDAGGQFPYLNKEETAQLITYLSYIRYIGESGDYLKGRKLLETKGCVLCHKFAGKGGDIGPDLSKKGEYISPLILVESIWNHAPDMVEIFEKNNIERPEFSNNEIVDLASGIQSYISTNKVPLAAHDLGDPLNGRKLTTEKGCLHCHSISGKGGNLGPDFSTVDLNCSVTQIAGKMWNHSIKMMRIMKEEGISYPVFGKGELADVIAYLYSLQLEDAPGYIEKGKILLAERGCLSCHDIGGKSRKDLIDLTKMKDLDSPLAMICAMWNHSPAMQKKLLEKNLNWPELDGREIANIYAYLQSIVIPSVKNVN